MMLTGYHGTKAEDADSIRADGFDLSKSGTDQWLGPGVYFFGDLYDLLSGQKEALHWIRIKGYSKWGIIKSIIESDKVLDLLRDNGAQKRFTDLLDDLYAKHKRLKLKETDFCGETAFNIICSKHELDVVICFIDGTKPYNSSIKLTKARRYIGRPQIQYCVRKVTDIKSIEIVDRSQ